jgi:hypothetical protein
MNIVKVTGKNHFRIPAKYRSTVRKNKQFIISKSEDSLLLKPFRSVLLAADLHPDPNPPTLEEINRIVHEVRRQHSKKRK